MNEITPISTTHLKAPVNKNLQSAQQYLEDNKGRHELIQKLYMWIWILLGISALLLIFILLKR